MQAILVAIKLDDNKFFEETLLECQNLCGAAGIEVIETVVQASHKMDPNTAVRSGKLEEIRELLMERECHQIVFYNNLSTSVVSKLKDLLGADVMDRTSLILHIFSLRARSKEAQIQTEIARLKYDMPQLIKDNMDEDKQRGGTVNNRGAGETRSTIIRRAMESRINDLKAELKKLENRKDNEYNKRSESSLKKVALVGYTNAGKSSLMNVLLAKNEKKDKAVLEKDQLFATLDTSIRNIKYNKNEFLLFDTVGFVSDLPHQLVDAFKSTLKAASYADLLVHVIDVSNPNYTHQMQVTLDTLKQIGANNIPMINVFNKCDLLEQLEEEQLYISCKEDIGVDALLEEVVEKLYPKDCDVELLIPYSKLSVVAKYQKSVEFTLLENQEAGSLYRVQASDKDIETIQKIIAG